MSGGTRQCDFSLLRLKCWYCKPVHGCHQPPPQVWTGVPVQSPRCRRSCHSWKLYFRFCYDEETGHLDEDVLGLEIPVGDRWLQTLTLVGSKLTWFSRVSCRKVIKDIKCSKIKSGQRYDDCGFWEIQTMKVCQSFRHREADLDQVLFICTFNIYYILLYIIYHIMVTVDLHF